MSAQDDSTTSAARRLATLESLELLDGLLDTITDVLDVREVFERVSGIAQRVLPHDVLGVVEVSEDGNRVKLYATIGSPDIRPFDMPTPRPELLTQPWDVIIVDDIPGDPHHRNSPASIAGMVSAIGIPVRFGGRLQAVVSFFSRTKARFSRDDLPFAQRVARHIGLAMSHHRLAEEARQRHALEARAANLELLDQVLGSVTDAAPLTEVFDRVSEIARKVIPHDSMAVPVLLPDGRHARMYASSGMDRSDMPEQIPVPPAYLDDPTWEFEVIEDAAARTEPYNQNAAARGYRSALRLPIRIDGQFVAGLAFMSREPNVYHARDVVVARRIADRFAACLARDRRVDALRRADEASARAAKLESRVRELTEELDARTGFRRVIGLSPSWKQVLTQATQVASTDTTVLLLGESGTGKEVVARFIHRASARAGGPFIALNCAALPEQLLEAELFGYERGAFTGATQSKPGQLEQAGGGTLFLDEVGEMAPAAQAKFLRVLQEREFQRLGGTRVLKTDARIVAATNRDLQKAIASGQFREDLFYRLNVFAIRLPALRDRREDILALSDAFVAEIGRSIGRPPAGISKDARTRLVDYHWPGNVRELRNILERAAILCDGGLITTEHLAIIVAVPSPLAVPVSPARVIAQEAPVAGDIAGMERAMVVQALETHKFNKSKAAKALGITRAQLYVRMRRYGLE